MKLERNLLVGLLNSAWSMLIGLAVVPLYLKYLGVEAYGLIGFFTTTQALLQLLDMGLAPTVCREVARCEASGDMRDARSLLHTLSVVYWAVAAGIVVFVFFLAPFVTQHWLQSKRLLPETILHAVLLMGFVLACRWPIGLYQGALAGAQRVAVSSGLNIVMGTLGSLGAVVILAYVSASVEVFFMWQAAVGLLYAGIIQRVAKRVVGLEKSQRFEWGSLKRVWRFSAGMSAVALIGVFLGQIDKLILSKLLVLEEFGLYMLATVIVSTLYALVTPFFNVIYPRFSVLVASGNEKQLSSLYRSYTQILASFIFPVAMFLAIFSKELVTLWTGNAVLAAGAAPIIALLSIGSALHGVMYIQYALQLAHGDTRLPLLISCLLMIFLVPLIFSLTLAFGAQGAAMAWLILHVAYLVIGTLLTHRYLLKGIAMGWILRDVGIPLGVTASVGLFGIVIIELGDFLGGEKLCFGGGLALLAIILSGALSPLLRVIMRNKLAI